MMLFDVKDTFRRISVLFLFAGFCGAGFAQSLTDSILYIDEVVVSAKTFRRIIPVQKLEGEELERLNSQSVADALRYFSGVQLKDYGGIGGLKTVNIRSMGSVQTGVFYDGVQVGNAQNGIVDLGRFSLDNMEEISLYQGQKSEIFQPAKDFASASSIYLKPKKPYFQQGQQTHLSAKFKTGSFALLNPSVLWMQKISERVHSSVSAEWVHSDGKYKFRYKRVRDDGSVAYDTTAIRENGDINAFRTEAGLNGYFETGHWTVRAYFYDSERGLPGPVVEGRFTHGQRLSDRNFFLQSSFLNHFSDRYKIQGHAKYAVDYTRYIDRDSPPLQVDNTYNQQELYFSVTQLYEIMRAWNIALSTDFQRNILESDLQDKHPNRSTLLSSLASSLDLNKFKVQAVLLGSFIADHANVTTDYTRKLAPAIFVGYRPLTDYDLDFRAFYKRMFRMPTFNELYYTVLVDSRLKPECADQYNLGLVFSQSFDHSFLNFFRIQSDIYYNSIHDKIVAFPGNNQFRWTTENLDKVEIKGIDVSIQTGGIIRENMLLKLLLNYTYQDAVNKSDPSDYYYNDQIPYIPRHSGSCVLSGSWKSWDANYSFIYSGERYSASENKPENYIQPWYTNDLSIIKSFQYKGIQYKCMVELNNLLNQYYDVVINYPMPGRNYRFLLQIVF